jgi:hypothetical protein
MFMLNSLLKFLCGFGMLGLGASTAGATTAATLAEAIPTIVAAALLELDEGNVVQPLVTDVPFPGVGVRHDTPIINRIVAEGTAAWTSDDTLASQTMEASTSDETSPAYTIVAVHGAYISLKDIAALGFSGNAAAVAGQLIGQCLVVRRDLDLIGLFTGFTTNQGSATTADIAPADLYDAYGSLRKGHAPLPYHLVLHPTQIWSSHGLVMLFDNSTNAVQSFGVGTVGEDWARYGFAGMVMGFNLWSDANVPFTTATGSGLAFSREAMKNVRKRDFQIEIQRDAVNVADSIVGSEIRGEAMVRNKHGNEMQFPSFDAV